ncbi:hypothetical protein [Streptomyces sp. NPDC015414]|uniref:hypothetical protein n=1 Tax=Streptomyces sp. NPDC015414 TaxID=3364957 RepID=UPI0036FD75B0
MRFRDRAEAGQLLAGPLSGLRDRSELPGPVVLAVPVGAPGSLDSLAPEADTIVCPYRPAVFSAVGRWYDDFGQLTDADVPDALHVS